MHSPEQTTGHALGVSCDGWYHFALMASAVIAIAS
jgi:hypothetical protein